MSTDSEWEKWGAREPYFGVLTHPRFRAAALNEDARHEFFETGRIHVQQVIEICGQRVRHGFQPTRVLDFGCGVGRLVLPFARMAREVVGVDVSESMLREARRNADAAGLDNVVLVVSDDSLSAVDGVFDLVHSCIVIQHIAVDRGLQIFRELLKRIAPGGLGAIQVTFAWDLHQANHGLPPEPPPLTPWQGWLKASRELLRSWGLGPKPRPHPVPSDADPEMQMNFYNLSQLMFLLQQAGVTAVHSELTNHGGAMGAFLFFRGPGEPLHAAPPSPAAAGAAMPALSTPSPPRLPIRLPAAAPRRCFAGEAFGVDVEYTGSVTDLQAIDAAGGDVPPLVLAYHWRRHDGSIDTWDGLRTPLPDATGNAATTLVMQIVAPLQPGRYELELSALREGMHWLENLGIQPLVLDYEVVAPPPGLSNT